MSVRAPSSSSSSHISAHNGTTHVSKDSDGASPDCVSHAKPLASGEAPQRKLKMSLVQSTFRSGLRVRDDVYRCARAASSTTSYSTHVSNPRDFALLSNASRGIIYLGGATQAYDAASANESIRSTASTTSAMCARANLTPIRPFSSSLNSRAHQSRIARVVKCGRGARKKHV